MSHKHVTEEYFRGRLKGFHCETCGRVFKEGDIIFNPDDERDSPLIRGKYFCGAFCTNSKNDELKRLSSMA